MKYGIITLVILSGITLAVAAPTGGESGSSGQSAGAPTITAPQITPAPPSESSPAQALPPNSSTPNNSQNLNPNSPNNGVSGNIATNSSNRNGMETNIVPGADGTISSNADGTIQTNANNNPMGTNSLGYTTNSFVVYSNLLNIQTNGHPWYH